MGQDRLFPKESLNKQLPINFAVGEDQCEVMIDQVIYDYILKSCSSSVEAQELLHLFILENASPIERARANSIIQDSREDYLVNSIVSEIMNVTPVSLQEAQTSVVNFVDLEFQCGKVTSKEIKIPTFILSMMNKETIHKIVMQELKLVTAEKFDFSLFSNYIRGVLLSRLFENREIASNWV